MFVEPYIENLDIDKLLQNFNDNRYRLSSLVFEQLSIELLKLSFSKYGKIVEIASYWDRFSEFDILAKSSNDSLILGECKYKNRPVVKSELLKLKNKAINSNLDIDYFTLFSKSGFSSEMHKLNEKNLLLFELNDFKALIK